MLAVTNASDEVVLLSVTSCDPSFSPRFTSPLGTEVELQSRPLAEAERPDSPTPGWDDNRALSYAPWSTASSVAQLVEEGAATRNARPGRAYYVGANAVCADLDSLGLGTEPWFGALRDAPAVVRAARSGIAANFYAETVDLEVSLDENGQLGVLQDGVRVRGLFASPHHFDLPLDLHSPGGTRRF